MKPFLPIVAIFATLIFDGCDNTNILDTLINEPSLGPIVPPPPELQEVFWGGEWKKELLAKATTPDEREIPQQWLDSALKSQAYWTKYVNADGVVLFGSDNLPDEALYVARAIILEMTSKRPEIREYLTPNTQQPHLGVDTPGVTYRQEFHFLLLAENERVSEIPETGDWGVGSKFPNQHSIYHRRSSASSITKEMQIFVSVFARVMNSAIEWMDRQFDSKLKQAYAEWYTQSPRPKKGIQYPHAKYTYEDLTYQKFIYTDIDRKEFWAEAVRIWYFPSEGGFASREEFKRLYPTLTALLSEWISDGWLPIELTEHNRKTELAAIELTEQNRNPRLLTVEKGSIPDRTPEYASSTVIPPPLALQKILWSVEEVGLPMELIELNKRHRAYWTKYVDAGGIAIVGSDNLPDEKLYLARDIVLEITSKCPELRHILTPGWIRNPLYEYDTLQDTYLVVLADGETLKNIPSRYNNRDKVPLGVCGTMCVAPSHSEMHIFVHEFAHMIYSAIIRYLNEKLEYKINHAYVEWDITHPLPKKGIWYRDAKYRQSHMNSYEFWAEGVRLWYFPSEGGFASREEFKEWYPILTSILSEWISDSWLPIE